MRIVSAVMECWSAGVLEVLAPSAWQTLAEGLSKEERELLRVSYPTLL
jgi:uncharacterized protein YjeT (DUF2065 family)